MGADLVLMSEICMGRFQVGQDFAQHLFVGFPEVLVPQAQHCQQCLAGGWYLLQGVMGAHAVV